MRKLCRLLFMTVVLFASCSKKVHPAVSAPPKTRISPKTPETVTVEPERAIPAPTMPPAAKTFTVPLVVIDADGKIITSRDNLPAEIGEKVNYTLIAKAYTPAQRNNLIYRSKMIPPRVLFVPNELALTSTKGHYIIYKKKFWYWQKEDGLFHLDETYFQ